jgi:preprotein translocase subunit YajC
LSAAGFLIQIPEVRGSTLIECLFVNPVLLAADPGMGGALSQFLLLFAPLFAIWFFLVIRPQQQQRKKLQQMLADLKTGDRVVTSGGVYGTIMGFRNGVVQLQIASQVRIDLARSAITGLATGEAEAASPQESAAKPKK